MWYYPSVHILERYDVLRVSPHRKPALALRMPAAEPMNNTRSAYNIARGLALKLDLGAYFPFEKQEELLDWQLKQVVSSLEEMQRIGVKTRKEKPMTCNFAENENVTFSTDQARLNYILNLLSRQVLIRFLNILPMKNLLKVITG